MKISFCWPKITSFSWFCFWLNIPLYEFKLCNFTGIPFTLNFLLFMLRLPWNHRLPWTDGIDWKGFERYFILHMSENIVFWDQAKGASSTPYLPSSSAEMTRIKNKPLNNYSLDTWYSTLLAESDWGKMEGNLLHQRSLGALGYLR